MSGLLGRIRRKATAPPAARRTADDELFGGRRVLDRGFARHEQAGLQMSFLAMARRIPHLVARTAGLAWSVDRTALCTVAAAEAGQGLGAAFGLLATNRVLVRLFAAAPTAQRVEAALPSLAWVAAASALVAVLREISKAATGRLEPKVERAAAVQLLRPVIGAELAAIEDPEFRRLLDSAQYGTDAARRMVHLNVAVVNALISLASAAGVLAVLHPVLLPMLVLIALPKGCGAVRSARRRYRSIQAWLEHLRKRHQLAGLLIEQHTATEIRVHAVGPYLLRHFEAMSQEGEDEQARLARAEAATGLAAGAGSGIATAATFVVLGVLLTTGMIPLAVAGTAVIAIRTSTLQLGSFVGQVNQLYEESLFYTDLERAVARAVERAIPQHGTDVGKPPDEIRLENVTFTYPDRSAPAVDDVSLTVRRGQIVALVGENGSGKTTLSKLLAGLYMPDKGRITWDGTDITDLDRSSLFAHVTLIAQDFMRWPFTARTNILVGRPDVGPDPGRIDRAAAYAEADAVIAELPKGLDTLLDRNYSEGVNLSGGQWQHFALARAKFREGSVIIADEPTAALDARSEIAAFARIRELAADGCTVILISHRMASCRHADTIYVLHHGRLAEQGTHAALLARPGSLYASYYNLQADQFAP
ncbi:ABC transporter ATP-binding protein/permease [Streptomyces sp. ET3-23]|uniref:ABC transporter ATP-binding protein n=1 Tax=Streptomyces sp. ET3-23 TaxID=2885643 RepID=UPI001D1039CD|nr:ABC transporter ATP-binding protein [Streptomyces sp. ET3-23]MCC2278754.1 ABC transporter ATP-binding protein/permease [Streptomyces sp. ET3-23]